MGAGGPQLPELANHVCDRLRGGRLGRIGHACVVGEEAPLAFPARRMRWHVCLKLAGNAPHVRMLGEQTDIGVRVDRQFVEGAFLGEVRMRA